MVYDVIVDIRDESPTFYGCGSVELSAVNMRSTYVPMRFIHGFQTMENHTELIYHHFEYYSPEHEGALRYNDPRLGVEWLMEPSEISGKSKIHRLINHSFKRVVK